MSIDATTSALTKVRYPKPSLLSESRLRRSTLIVSFFAVASGLEMTLIPCVSSAAAIFGANTVAISSFNVMSKRALSLPVVPIFLSALVSNTRSSTRMSTLFALAGALISGLILTNCGPWAHPHAETIKRVVRTNLTSELLVQVMTFDTP